MSTLLNGQEALARALDSWNQTRSQTLDLIDQLTKGQLTAKFPRPLFDTFGKQFQELGVIQKAYSNAIQTGKVNYTEMMFDFDDELIISKSNIVQFLNEINSDFLQVIKGKDPFMTIDWGLPNNPILIEHIYWLNTHEILHHGQLVAYCYLLGIAFPISWNEAWSLPEIDLAIVKNWIAENSSEG